MLREIMCVWKMEAMMWWETKRDQRKRALGGDESERKKGEGFTNDSRSQEETHRCECMQI